MTILATESKTTPGKSGQETSSYGLHYQVGEVKCIVRIVTHIWMRGDGPVDRDEFRCQYAAATSYVIL